MMINDNGAIHHTGSKTKIARLIGTDKKADVRRDSCCGDKCLVESM